MKKTFIFYADWGFYTDEMTLEEKWAFLQAILDYQNWKEPDTSKIRMIWWRVKNQLDEDNSKWNETVSKRKEIWKEWWIKSWEAKRRKSKQNEAIALENEKNNEKQENIEKSKQNEADNDNDNDNDKYIVSNSLNNNTNTNLSITKVIDKPVSNETEKPEYWNPEINKMLAFLKKAVLVSDFKESTQMQRRYTQILCHMKNKIWVEEFAFRIKTILQDGFKAKNCNKISYLHGELKGFIHSPVVEVQDDRKIRTFEV